MERLMRSAILIIRVGLILRHGINVHTIARLSVRPV